MKRTPLVALESRANTLFSKASKMFHLETKIRPATGMAALAFLIVALPPSGSATCRAQQGWTPGYYMKESMIRLLAPASEITSGSDFGFWDTAYLGAYLRPGGFSYLTTTLEAGQTYAFVGAGNEPTRDLDLIIEDEWGQVVAEDVDESIAPVVVYQPARTGRYTIKLKLYDATTACFCGVALLKKNGWTVPVENLDVAMENVLARCDNVASQVPARFLQVPGEWAVIGTILREGASQTFYDISLGSGRRAVTSGGDTVTRDIDLQVYLDGSNPQVLDDDSDPDAAPLVECVASSSSRYGIVIKNAASNGGTLVMTAILEVD